MRGVVVDLVVPVAVLDRVRGQDRIAGQPAARRGGRQGWTSTASANRTRPRSWSIQWSGGATSREPHIILCGCPAVEREPQPVLQALPSPTLRPDCVREAQLASALSSAVSTSRHPDLLYQDVPPVETRSFLTCDVKSGDGTVPRGRHDPPLRCRRSAAGWARTVIRMTFLVDRWFACQGSSVERSGPVTVAAPAGPPGGRGGRDPGLQQRRASTPVTAAALPGRHRP